MDSRQAGISAPAASWRNAIRGNVLMMGLVSLFTDFSSEMINPLLPLYIAGLLADGSGGLVLALPFVGIMEGIAETTASLLKIFSGRISDAVGKRKALVVFGYGISTIARPVLALAASVPQVITLKFFDRVGKGVRTSPRDALIGDSVGPECRGLAFSFHRAMDHAGAILGPLAAVAILYMLLGGELWHGGTDAPTSGEMTALRWVFAAALLPGIAAMISLVTRVREIKPPPHEHSAAGPHGVRPHLPGKFYVFVAITTLFALGNSTDMFLVLLARTDFGMGLAGLIAVWIVLHLSKIAFSIPGGVLSDRLGRRPIIVAGWAVYAMVYFGLAFSSQMWQFWMLIIAYGVYYGLTEGAAKALVTDFVPGDRRATAFGVYHAAEGLAALPASVAFGFLWSWLGRAAAFGFGAALAAFAAILMAVLLSASKKTKLSR